MTGKRREYQHSHSKTTPQAKPRPTWRERLRDPSHLPLAILIVVALPLYVLLFQALRVAPLGRIPPVLPFLGVNGLAYVVTVRIWRSVLKWRPEYSIPGRNGLTEAALWALWWPVFAWLTDTISDALSPMH
jgi:hypothetical protein